MRASRDIMATCRRWCRGELGGEENHRWTSKVNLCPLRPLHVRFIIVSLLPGGLRTSVQAI